MRQKKIPLRMCCGCNLMKEKRELIRVVKSPQGDVSLDFTGKKAGRGAYICRNPLCLANARKSRRLEKSLSCTINSEVYEEMEKELAEKNS